MSDRGNTTLHSKLFPKRFWPPQVFTSVRPNLIATCRDAAKDVIGGLVASLVLIANIVSFGALMFQGELSAGVPIAIWSMLIGGSICGTWIALTTSLPPLATGIDSPTGAVLILLSAATGSSVIGVGGSPQEAIQTVMLVFTASTFLTGAALYGLGARQWGSYFRFVPYFVVGGFLLATGCFLAAGALRMIAHHPTPSIFAMAASWTEPDNARLVAAVIVLFVLLMLRRRVKSPLALPVVLIAMWLAAMVTLRILGLSDPELGWYFHSLGTLSEWFPFEAARNAHLTWSMLPQLVPEIMAVTIVALISLVTKVSSIEVTRQAAGDLNREFRSHGIASLIAAPFGGTTCSLQVATSRLCEQIGATRTSGVVCALVLGIVGIANYNILGLIPIPIIAGLVFYLGYNFIIEALWRPFAQRAWFDLFLALAIAVACIRYGYLIGILVGLACACLLFVISYSRLGVVRRHLTRAQFASHVDRSADASAFLREAGDAVHLYWLSGYIFFGSSEGVFEHIRADIEAILPRRVSYIILDCAMVSGADSSAFISLTKLHSCCEQQGTVLVYCSLSPTNRVAMERSGLFGGKGRHHSMEDLNLALAWCEDQLLAKANLTEDRSFEGFEFWLKHELGGNIKPSELMAYFERTDAAASQIIYRQGEPAETLDLVAAGSLVVEITSANGQKLRVRRITTHTVVGEMGFFRRSLRSATVSSEGQAIIFTLTRAKFETMRRERADLASALVDFIMRVLADRIDGANRQASALE
jgi:SulP family sulfate permease